MKFSDESACAPPPDIKLSVEDSERRATTSWPRKAIMARSKTVAFVAILALTTVGTLATASAQQSDISHLGEKMLQYQDSKIVVVPRGGLK